jgi:hypothetical protein
MQLRTYLQTCRFTFFYFIILSYHKFSVNLTENVLLGKHLCTVSCICVQRPLQPITIHVTTMTKPRPFHSLHELVWLPVNLVYCNHILYISRLPPPVCEAYLLISLPRQIQDRCQAINHDSPAVKDRLWNCEIFYPTSGKYLLLLIPVRLVCAACFLVVL